MKIKERENVIVNMLKAFVMIECRRSHEGLELPTTN